MTDKPKAVDRYNEDMNTYFIKVLSLGWLGVTGIALGLGVLLDAPIWLSTISLILGFTCVFVAGWKFLTTPAIWAYEDDGVYEEEEQ
jgi:uncharacterized membrane protein YkgB